MGRKSREKRERRRAAAQSQPVDLLDTPFGKLHLAAKKLADNGANRSASLHADAPDDIVRAALHSIMQDAVVTHYAVLTLVKHGYASSAAANVRTLLDLFIAVVAILRSKDPKLMAFRYFFASYRDFSRDIDFSQDERKAARDAVRARIALLPPRISRQP